jgi:hypothetical protein
MNMKTKEIPHGIGLTAAFALVFGKVVLGFDDTATRSFSAQSRIDNSRGTTNTSLHGKCF